MHGDNGKPFIIRLYNILLESDLCDQLFYNIKLMNPGNTCIFHKGFYTVFSVDIEQDAVTLPHREQGNHLFLVNTKEKSK